MIKHEYTKMPANGHNMAKSMISVIKGTVAGYIFLVVAFGFLAVIYTYTAFPAGMLSPFTQGITAFSIILCGILSSRNIQGFGWLHGMAAGFVYSIVRFIAGAFASNGFGFDKNLFSMLLFGLLLGAAGGIIGINFKRNNGRR